MNLAKKKPDHVSEILLGNYTADMITHNLPLSLQAVMAT